MHDIPAAWHAYRTRELAAAAPVLESLGFVLDAEQVHLAGERSFLSGRKLVLTGRRSADGRRAVIKVTSDARGAEEIAREHRAREALHSLDFAYRPFYSPLEFLYARVEGFRVMATEFIDEARGFLQHSLNEQFFLALGAFEAQEGVHATTYAHAHTIRSIFGMYDAPDYLREFEGFRREFEEVSPNADAREVLAQTSALLQEHRTEIARYAGFLTHADFVPHNLRIRDGRIYLLDYSSLRFGNKYESWARFINYMTLYHPELEQALMAFVRDNRSTHEYRALQLMRAYKLGFLVAFYAKNAAGSSGNAKTLAVRRVAFWTEALRAVLHDRPLAAHVVTDYKADRDLLRTPEEIERQKALNQL